MVAIGATATGKLVMTAAAGYDWSPVFLMHDEHS